MNKPIILDNAVLRKGDNIKIFDYDYQSDVNIVRTKRGEIPFINLSSSANELETVTKVAREEDDESFNYELYTKTDVKRERDDETSSYLELTTKTFVERERDDEDTNYNK